MRLTPSDPDVETLIGRIATSEIDLQPDFQRGEVWPISKKQRLIDSILREWHVPPIHLIVDPDTKRAAVLDGQQRLAAIRDFADNLFKVDGKIEPLDAAIAALDGKAFSDLPRDWKARFNQFTIRVFRITDYEPSEPAELFFRLNQPTALTSAEKRNAFFGLPREQIRELVERMESAGLTKDFWGFSSARMAYDDILARACLTLERGSFKTKVSANALADRYRSGQPFSPDSVDQLRDAIDALIRVTTRFRPHRLSSGSFNKATAQTFLVFVGRLAAQYKQDPTRLASDIEGLMRNLLDLDTSSVFGWDSPLLSQAAKIFGEASSKAIAAAYFDRATSRVADTSSVAIRDCALWAWFFTLCDNKKYKAVAQVEFLSKQSPGMTQFNYPADFERWVLESGWDLR